MTISNPSMLSYNLDTIKQKFNDIIALGYSYDEVINITILFPQIYSLSIETIKNKINFYKAINIHKVFIKDPRQLMQSIELSYARYMFYSSKCITIDENNYRKLFVGEKHFKNSFNLFNSDLLYMYDYNEFINKNKKEK